MAQLKLTNAQKEVVRRMRDGVGYYFNPYTSHCPYTFGGFGVGIGVMSAHGTVMNSLKNAGIVTMNTKVNAAIFKFELTPLGKEINIDL